MTSKITDMFYIGLIKEGDDIVGHRFSSDPTSFVESDPPEASPDSTAVVLPSINKIEFADVFGAFVMVMESYRKFIPLTMSLAPVLSAGIAEGRIRQFVQTRGVERTDLSNNGLQVYEVDTDHFREFSICNDEATAALEGAKHIPEVMLIGLVSTYDAFFMKLLKVVLTKNLKLY